MATQTNMPIDWSAPLPSIVADIRQASMPTSVVSAEVQQAVDRVIAFGGRYKSLAKEMDSGIRKDIGALKKAFGIAQGTTGRSLNINGKTMKWDEFCEKYFDLSPRRVNALLQMEDYKVAGITPIKKQAQQKPVRVAPPAAEEEEEEDDAQDERYSELELLAADLQAAEDEKAALEAEIERMHATADVVCDPVDVLLSFWRTLTPGQVQAELTGIITALNLVGVLTVNLIEVD